MPDVVVRAAGVGTVLLGPGESLAFGRAPHGRAGPGGPGRTELSLPDCAPHVSRLVGELQVGAERAMLRWLGSGAAQLAGLFDAPAAPGASR